MIDALFKLRPTRQAFIVGLFCLLVVAQMWRSGPCVDESAHIPAGLYHLETGRMDAYRVNPPLPRMIAALPLLVDRPRLQWFSMVEPNARNEFEFADNWIADNPADIARQLRLARSTMLIWFVLGAWTIFRWTRELYGKSAAWLAMFLWCMSPDVVTYSATVAPDLPAAASGLFAAYCFWNWIRKNDPAIPWSVGFGVALAVLSKFSWLFLFPVFPLLTLLRDSIWTRRCAAGVRPNNRWLFMASRLGGLSVALLLSILLVNVLYGFEGTGQRLRSFAFLSKTLGGEGAGKMIPDKAFSFSTSNRFKDSALGFLPIPIPREMLQGIDYVKWEFERKLRCYLRGRWQEGGWWYFYLYAIAVKMPLGYLLLIFLGGVSMASSTVHALWHCFAPQIESANEPGVDRRCNEAGRDDWLVGLLAVMFIAQVSSQTGFTHHVRYVLPAFGFLFIIAARSAIVLPWRIFSLIVGLCLAGVALFHTTHLGQSHTFFSFAAGGPSCGWRHLSHSNVDWGQSTFRMADWARNNKDKRPLTILFASATGHPKLLLSDLDVETAAQWRYEKGSEYPVPLPGWYLISSFQLTFDRLRYFQMKEPVSWPYADTALYYVPPPTRSSVIATGL